MSQTVAVDLSGARRRVQRIRLLAESITDSLGRLREVVQEAKDNDDWSALGYASWTAYLADVFGPEPLLLARDVRQELVAELSAQGMSTRAIAPIVGVDRKTVERDVRGGTNVPPDVPTARPVTPLTGVLEEIKAGVWIQPGAPEIPDMAPTPYVDPPKITGLDGKQYSKPTAPSEPRRTSLVDTSRIVGYDLRKVIERLGRIESDDRLTRNKAEVFAALQPHLDLAEETLARLRDRLN